VEGNAQQNVQVMAVVLPKQQAGLGAPFDEPGAEVRASLFIPSVYGQGMKLTAERVRSVEFLLS